MFFKDKSDDDTSSVGLFSGSDYERKFFTLNDFRKGYEKEDNIYIGSFSDDNEE